jgi:hypothetical protein
MWQSATERRDPEVRRNHAAPEIPEVDRYSGLLKEMYNNCAKYDVMARRVRSGMLWTRGAEFVHAKAVGRGQLGMCWKRFYQYERFAWLPNAIIPGWRPSCPNEDCHCDTNNDKLSVQSRTTPRRCVYGLIKNCILDSPVQWICKSCQLKSLNEEAIGVPKKDLSKYRPACFKGVEEQTS